MNNMNEQEESDQPSKKKRRIESDEKIIEKTQNLEKINSNEENDNDIEMKDKDIIISGKNQEFNEFEKQFREALMYDNGENGFSKDYDKATKMLRDLSKKKFSPAKFWLGIHYLTGIGGLSDRKKGLSVILSAAKDSMQYFETGCANGDKFSQFALAIMNWYGLVVPENNEKAFSLFELAGKQKLACSLSSMGEIYEIGEGVPKSRRKAFECFKMAADLGYPEAQAKMGLIYQLGDWESTGIDQDDEAATNYYEKAAEQMNVDALYNLAAMYEYGSSTVIRDPEISVHLYKKAAAHGEIDAALYLGYIYEKGKTVPKRDKNKSLHYYRICARDSHPSAALKLAHICMNGTLLSKKFLGTAFDLLSSVDISGDRVTGVYSTMQNGFKILKDECIGRSSIFQEENKDYLESE